MRARIWGPRNRIRFGPLVSHLRELGDRALYEFFDELIGDDPFTADDVELQLGRYARVSPFMLDVLDARDIEPPLIEVEGGRRVG